MSALVETVLRAPDPRAALRVTGKVARLGGQLAVVAAEAFLSADLGERARIRRRARTLHRAVRELAGAFGVEIDVQGIVPRAPVVLVANHLGYFDALVVGALTPCVPIAKAEVSTWPVLGERARELGVVFVRREDPVSGAMALRAAARALDAGISVLNFPEGTTTYGDEVLAFRRGIFGLAMRAGVPVVPVRIEYEDRDACWVGDTAFLPHVLGMSARRRIRARVRIGRPIAQDEARSADDLARLARFVIAKDLSRRS